jgi:uncharacterized membrane protein
MKRSSGFGSLDIFKNTFSGTVLYWIIGFLVIFAGVMLMVYKDKKSKFTMCKANSQNTVSTEPLIEPVQEH